MRNGTTSSKTPTPSHQLVISEAITPHGLIVRYSTHHHQPPLTQKHMGTYSFNTHLNELLPCMEI